jgi:hypothetical protein
MQLRIATCLTPPPPPPPPIHHLNFYNQNSLGKMPLRLALEECHVEHERPHLPPPDALSYPYRFGQLQKQQQAWQEDRAKAHAIVRILREAGATDDDQTPIRKRFIHGPQGADIGVFVAVSDFQQMSNGYRIPAISASGAQWLTQPALPEPLPHPDDVAALVRAFNDHETSTPSASRPPLSDSPAAFSCVSQAACITLRNIIDQAHTRTYSQQLHDHAGAQPVVAVRNKVADGVAAGSHEGDFKLLLTLHELRSIVGDDACERILSALETDTPDAIALRRTTASGRWINFHTDAAARTVQVVAHGPFFSAHDM